MTAEELEILAKKQNNGRGVEHIKSVIFYLKNDMREQALAVAKGEMDKTRAYPELVEAIDTIFPEIKAEKERIRKLFGWD